MWHEIWTDVKWYTCLFWGSSFSYSSNAGIFCEEKGSCWSCLHDRYLWTASERDSVVSLLLGTGLIYVDIYHTTKVSTPFCFYFALITVAWSAIQVTIDGV